MAENKYSWKRFWSRLDVDIPYDARGFIQNPDHYLLGSREVHPVPFRWIQSKKCLVLLGEAGIGKTTVLSEVFETLKAELRDEDVPLWINLKAYGTAELLQNNLFNTQQFLKWQTGTSRLYLFLDGLDEADSRLSVYLIEQLRNYDTNRLIIRITCRSTQWPVLLEKELIRLWGISEVGCFRLTPLRKVDVEIALVKEGLDRDLFIEEITKRALIPFAIRPLTLRFLINHFKDSGKFPASLSEIYLEGCKKLCTEENGRVTSSGKYMSPLEKIKMAGRIAAVSIFSGSPIIIDDNSSKKVPKALKIEELSSTKLTEFEEFGATELAVRDTLNSGLFTPYGTESLVWSHHSYAEFLAANYLTIRKLPLKQLRSLFKVPTPNGGVKQGLWNTAAWIASTQQDFYEELLELDPEAIVYSSVPIKSGQEEIIFSKWLDNLDRWKRIPTFSDYELIQRLYFPELKDYLEKVTQANKDSVLFLHVISSILRAFGINEIETNLTEPLPVFVDGEKLPIRELLFNSSEILSILENPQTRLVNTGEELVDVIIESLERLQKKLHGETPAAIDLWNEQVKMEGEPRKRIVYYWPKDENRMSDYIKRHLELDVGERGIVVSREVEIRRGSNRSGERTDIHITAVSSDPNKPTIKLIVESKLFWNSDIKSAMKEQLLDRYLKENECKYGIYLVGWFKCPQWPDSNKHMQFEDCVKFFKMQAEQFSNIEGILTPFILNASLRS